MSFVTTTYTLCNKGIVFDNTPSFVTVCVNWIPGHTYGVYLVLSLKLGATSFNQTQSSQNKYVATCMHKHVATLW